MGAAKKDEKNKLDYTVEVIDLLERFGTANELGQIIIDVLEKGTLVYSIDEKTIELQVFVAGDFKKFKDMPEWDQYDIYGYIADNQHFLNTMCKNAIVEVETTADMNWVVAPQPLKSKAEGGEEILIGSLAIAREVRVGEAELRSVLFISPDGTWTTLTCYNSVEDSEKDVAKMDMRDIAEAITNFIEKL